MNLARYIRKPVKLVNKKSRATEDGLRKLLERLSDEDMNQFDSALAAAIGPRDKARGQAEK
jgi:hypothetical protein